MTEPTPLMVIDTHDHEWDRITADHAYHQRLIDWALRHRASTPCTPTASRSTSLTARSLVSSSVRHRREWHPLLWR